MSSSSSQGRDGVDRATKHNRRIRIAGWMRDWLGQRERWRRGSESNRRTRSCSPLHNHSATAPFSKNPDLAPGFEIGAGNEIRTRDPNLGKVVLYQLSYSRLKLSITKLFCSIDVAACLGRARFLCVLFRPSLITKVWYHFCCSGVRCGAAHPTELFPLKTEYYQTFLQHQLHCLPR